MRVTTLIALLLQCIAAIMFGAAILFSGVAAYALVIAGLLFLCMSITVVGG